MATARMAVVLKRMIKPERELTIRHGARLPHWTREGATYAVVFRLGGSLPSATVDSWRFERQDIIRTAKKMGRPLTAHEQGRLDNLYSEKVERYLAEG